MKANAPKAGGPEPADAPDLFPAEGSFNAVVPLSKLGGPEATEGASGGGAEYEVQDQEVATITRPRVAARPKLPRQPWLLTLLLLVLSMLAGLLAGNYLLGGLRPAERSTTQPAASPAEPQMPAPAPAAPPEEAARASVSPETKTEKAKPAEPAPTPSPTPAAAEPRRPARAETPRVEVGAAARTARPAPPPAEKPAPRPAPPAPRPARRTEARATKSPPPVFSPTPSPGKAKVVPWP